MDQKEGELKQRKIDGLGEWKKAAGGCNDYWRKCKGLWEWGKEEEANCHTKGAKLYRIRGGVGKPTLIISIKNLSWNCSKLESPLSLILLENSDMVFLMETRPWKLDSWSFNLCVTNMNNESNCKDNKHHISIYHSKRKKNLSHNQIYE